MTLHQLATLVKRLRASQKSNGLGYRSPSGAAEASTLERQVDDAVEKALEPWPLNVFEAVDS